LNRDNTSDRPADHLLEVRNLRIALNAPGPGGTIVDGLSFTLAPGEVLGIVGESGCGKTVTARSIIGLNRFDGRFRLSGEMVYKGRDLLRLDEAGMRRVRGKEIAMIFQDPMTSLNPLQRIGTQIGTDAISQVLKEFWPDIKLKWLHRNPGE